MISTMCNVHHSIITRFGKIPILSSFRTNWYTAEKIVPKHGKQKFRVLNKAKQSMLAEFWLRNFEKVVILRLFQFVLMIADACACGL